MSSKCQMHKKIFFPFLIVCLDEIQYKRFYININLKSFFSNFVKQLFFLYNYTLI
uniref:Uncharacterized protein n=1 Tax=Anguilla anguilla TaxID=7936 RepID=A0A0E9WK02_ANGAN